MFYLVVIILIINIIASFTAGVYQGLRLIENLTTAKILSTIGISLLIIVLIVGISFFVLRWGFNKLYGRYLVSLSETLRELDESEIVE